MGHVGLRGTAAIAQHVGHVLGGLQGASQRGPARPHARRPAVEGLAERKAVRGGRGTVDEARGHQLDLRPLARQGGCQRVVVGQDIRGGIDEVYPHRRPTFSRERYD